MVLTPAKGLVESINRSLLSIFLLKQTMVLFETRTRLQLHLYIVLIHFHTVFADASKKFL